MFRVGYIFAEYCIPNELICDRALCSFVEGIVSDQSLLNIVFQINVIFDRVLNFIEGIVPDISLLSIIFLINVIFDRVLYSLIEGIVSGLFLLNSSKVCISLSSICVSIMTLLQHAYVIYCDFFGCET